VSVSSEVAPVKLSAPAGRSCGRAVRDAALPTTGPNAIVVVMDDTGALRDLSWVPADTVDISPIPINSPEGRSVLRHSLAHLTAQAVQELFPEARLGIGPPIENGYYYDFLISRPFTPQDLQDIEARMRRIIKRGQSFRRRVFDSVEEARKELQHEPLKLELIESKANAAGDEAVEVGGTELSIYDNIDMPTKEVVWSDLCRGPHLPSTKYIGAFKLTRNAAAYARHVQQSLRCSGARTELDARDETLNSRIRSAQLQKVPLTIVVGALEKEHGTVAVRKRGKRDTHTMSLADLVSSLTTAKRDRLAELPTE
jgi:threonyl-tRNA synthetase